MILVRHRLLFLLTVVSLTGCSRSEEQTSDIPSSRLLGEPQSLVLSTNIHDTDTNGDGLTDRRIKRVSRGEPQKTILVEIYEAGTDGELELRHRTFKVGDETPFSEADDDKDGFLETVIVYSSDRNSLEVFERHHDGSISPASSEEMMGYKQMHTALSSFFDQTFEGQLEGDEVSDLFQETRQELKDAEAKINAARSEQSADQNDSSSGVSE